jgi:hypothetical protein
MDDSTGLTRPQLLDAALDGSTALARAESAGWSSRRPRPADMTDLVDRIASGRPPHRRPAPRIRPSRRSGPYRSVAAAAGRAA